MPDMLESVKSKSGEKILLRIVPRRCQCFIWDKSILAYPLRDDFWAWTRKRTARSAISGPSARRGICEIASGLGRSRRLGSGQTGKRKNDESRTSGTGGAFVLRIGRRGSMAISKHAIGGNIDVVNSLDIVSLGID